jgi:hypothetical protein
MGSVRNDHEPSIAEVDRMHPTVKFFAIALSLSGSPAFAAELTGRTPAGVWYDVTHEERDAWISHIVSIAKSDVPPDRLGPQVRNCLHDTAEVMEKRELAEITALCIMRAR